MLDVRISSQHPKWELAVSVRRVAHIGTWKGTGGEDGDEESWMV